MSRAFSLSLYLTLARRQRTLSQDLVEDKRPEGVLVWCHAHNSDQAAAFAELATALEMELARFHMLLTAGAAGVLDALRTDCPDYLSLRLLAGDDPRVAAHWRPDVVVWTVTASHPAITANLDSMKIPQFLADARAELPTRPLNQKIPGLRRALLSCFDKILTVDDQATKRLNEFDLGPDRVETNGLLLQGAAVPACNEAELAELGRVLAARPVWLAAEVYLSEVSALLDAHQIALGASHRLLLIVVPKRSEDGPEMMRIFDDAGFSVSSRSADAEPEPGIQIYVADTEGELGLWLRLSPVSFIGGSFAGLETADPFAAAALGSAVVFGHEPGSHLPHFRRLVNAGAAVQVSSGHALGNEIERLLSPDKAASLSHRAWEEISTGAPALDRISDLVRSELDQQAERHPDATT